MKTVQADSCLNSEQNGTVFIYRQANNIASGGPFGSLCYSEIVSLCFPSKVNFMIIFWPWGAMYEHLRVVPPGKRLRVPSCTRPEILGSG